MFRQSWRTTLAGLLLIAAVLACNIKPATGANPSPTRAPTNTATDTFTPTDIATDTFTPIAPALNTSTDTTTPSPLPIQTSSLPGNALVANSALCWLGPGKAYDVSSSIGGGTRVDLLGRSPIDGWWIIRNPRYHDPCWIEAIYLQIDTGVNVLALPIYQIPPTSTPTP
jgi:hypothetical protein